MSEPAPANRILIVDDDESFVRSLTTLLEGEGFRVVQARNGLDALSKALIHKPDLICLDLMMPALGGYTVCAELRKEPATRDVPIIIMTSSTKDEHRTRSIETGANDFLTKPFEGRDLVRRIRTILDRRRDGGAGPG